MALHAPILTLLADLGACADEHDEYGGFVVWGCRDALAHQPEPEFTDGTEASCLLQGIAWRAGNDLGKRHEEVLSS